MIGGESAVWPAWVAASSGTHVVDRIVEPEAALVAQQEDGGRREALGHRGDPEAAVPIGRCVVPTRSVPWPFACASAAVDDDPVGEARDDVARGEPLEDGVDLGQGVAQGHLTRVPSRPAARRNSKEPMITSCSKPM